MISKLILSKDQYNRLKYIDRSKYTEIKFDNIWQMKVYQNRTNYRYRSKVNNNVFPIANPFKPPSQLWGTISLWVMTIPGKPSSSAYAHWLYHYIPWWCDISPSLLYQVSLRWCWVTQRLNIFRFPQNSCRTKQV